MFKYIESYDFKYKTNACKFKAKKHFKILITLFMIQSKILCL